MRHDEIRLGDMEISEEKNVDVQSAGSVADRADSAGRLLESLRQMQEPPGARAGLEPDYAVQVPGLACRTAERSRLVYGRDRQIRIDLLQCLHRHRKMGHAVAHVRAKAEERLHPQTGRSRRSLRSRWRRTPAETMSAASGGRSLRRVTV